MNELPKISSESSIRLTPFQIQSIKSCIFEVFGEKLKIYLFGSRTNPLLRGGDIDFFVYPESIDKTTENLNLFFSKLPDFFDFYESIKNECIKRKLL